MSLTILDRTEMLDQEMRQFTQRRFQFALSRFDSRISGAKVTVVEASMIGKAVQHECQVTVELKRACDVVLTEQGLDISKCIARAAERTGRAVGRAIDRSWDAVSPDAQLHTTGTLI